MKMNRNVNKYIKDCKHFFPFLSKNEKIFLKRLKTNIIENIDSDNITYDDLCNEFGYPSDIIISYFEDQDANYLIKILYLIFDYPHKHYTFKYFEV